MCCFTSGQVCAHNTDCCSNYCDGTNHCTTDTTCH
jgi:hypothetical protein